MSKIIPNTNERYSITIDGDVYDNIKQRKLKQSPSSYGYMRTTLVMNDNKVYTKCIHRLVAEAFIEDYTTDKLVDHRDNNKFNNNVNNLRMATIQQNTQNRKKTNNNTSSIYKGVYKQNGHGIYCWRASIMVNGNRKHLGYYSSELDAANAYNLAAVNFHGEFAYLNKTD